MATMKRKTQKKTTPWRFKASPRFPKIKQERTAIIPIRTTHWMYFKSSALDCTVVDPLQDLFNRGTRSAISMPTRIAKCDQPIGSVLVSSDHRPTFLSGSLHPGHDGTE